MCCMQAVGPNILRSSAADQHSSLQHQSCKVLRPGHGVSHIPPLLDLVGWTPGRCHPCRADISNRLPCVGKLRLAPCRLRSALQMHVCKGRVEGGHASAMCSLSAQMLAWQAATHDCQYALFCGQSCRCQWTLLTASDALKLTSKDCLPLKGPSASPL